MIPHRMQPYATVPTLFEKVHDELSAIQEITTVLGSLPDQETRARVVRWINERFGANSMTLPAVAAAAPATAAMPDAAPPEAHGSVLMWPDAEGLRIPDAEDLFDRSAAANDAVDVQDLSVPADAVPEAIREERSPEQARELFELVASAQWPVDAQAEPHDNHQQVSASDTQPEQPSTAPATVVSYMPPAPLVDPEPQSEPRMIVVQPDVEVVAPAVASVDAEADMDREPVAVVAAEPAMLAAPAIADEPVAPEPMITAPDAEIAPAPVLPVEPIRARVKRVSEEPPAESMEAMLHSLIADFRQLADEWGNT